MGAGQGAVTGHSASHQRRAAVLRRSTPSLRHHPFALPPSSNGGNRFLIVFFFTGPFIWLDIQRRVHCGPAGDGPRPI